MKRTKSNTTILSNPWDCAKNIKVYRGGNGYPVADLEGGVKFFVLMLEQIGATTIHSCEGHPRGFYVSFRCSYDTALSISSCGYFNVAIVQANTWTIRLAERLVTSARVKAQYLSEAARSWEEKLGKLKLPHEVGEPTKTAKRI